MATFPINIDDAILNRVLNKFAKRHHYDPERDDTKAEFLKKKIRWFVKQSVIEQEHDDAGKAAAKAAEDAAELEIIIT